jgi:MFS family permease
MENPGIKANEKIWSRDFVTIFIVSFVMSMGQFMMNTLIPKYAYQLGGAASVAGTVTGIFAVTALGIRPIAGPAMDYFKKNRMLTLSIGIIAVSFVFYGFARDIPMLITARLIHGLGIGLSAPLSLALVSNILPPNKMASGLGVYSLGSAVATAIGPTIGLKLSAVIGYNDTFFICTGLMVTCFFLSLRVRSDTPVRTSGFRISLNQIVAPEVILPTLVIFFQIISFSSINAFIAIFGGLAGVADIGLYFTANAICLIFIRPFSGRIADRYGLDKLIVPGLFIFIGALILTSFSRSLPMFILAGVVTALGFGISEPMVQTMNMQLVPRERRGAAGNTNFLGIDVGMLLGPTLAGFIITSVEKTTGDELLGFSTMYRVMVLPTVVAIVLFLICRKKLLARIRAQKTAAEEEYADS